MIDGLKPYPAMKDSGVPWLGEVPEHWEVSRLKGLLTRNDSGVWGDKFDEAGTVILRSTEQTIDGGWRIMNPAKILLPPSQRDAALLAPGDLVVTKSSGSPAHIGKTSLVSSNVAALGCCFSNFMQRLRPGKRLDSAFLWRLLNSPVGREQLVFQATTTTGLGNLNGTILGECRIGLPPLPEQAAIVRFLDHADRRIRRYIRAKQKLIKLLEEQKQAIIHRAVTGQIDVRTGQPYPRYKPSGVEWLGEVPEHWQIKRLKSLVRNVIDQTTKHEGGELYVALEHVESWTGRLRPAKSNVNFDSQVKRFRAGDILFGKLRPYLAKVARPISGGVCVGEFLVLRPRESDGLAPYLEQLLRSKPVIDAVNSSTFGAKMPRADWQFIGGLALTLPPLPEQAAIVRFLDQITSEIVQTIERAKREIELMREFRTRLIADVVTGKLDVREAAARLPEEAEESEPLDEDQALGEVDEESAADSLAPEPQEVEA